MHRKIGQVDIQSARHMRTFGVYSMGTWLNVLAEQEHNIVPNEAKMKGAAINPPGAKL